MEGLMFKNEDYGQGGPEGFLDSHKVWCVNVDGIMYHIHRQVTGDDTEGTKVNISVETCDGSCRKLYKVDDSVVAEALPKIPVADRSLSTDEKEKAAELPQADYLSELVDSYRSLQKDLEREIRSARKGLVLFSEVTCSFWGPVLFKKEIEEYNESK